MTADFQSRRGFQPTRRDQVTTSVFAAIGFRAVWFRLRRIAAHAVNRRMDTEMSDLAMRIRKLQDIEDNDFQRRSRGR